MVDHNERFIQTVQIDEIPWHRITTTYARATDFPKYFNVLWQMSDMKEVDKAGREIEINIEHQSTLWHVTPFAMIFLVRIFKKAVEKMENSSIATYLEEQLLELFIEIAEAICGVEALEHEEALPNFSDMLNEEYLWSEEYDEEIDALRYEEEIYFTAFTIIHIRCFCSASRCLRRWIATGQGCFARRYIRHRIWINSFIHYSSFYFKFYLTLPTVYLFDVS